MPHCSENAAAGAAVAAKPELNRLVSPQSDPTVIVEHGATLYSARSGYNLGLRHFAINVFIEPLPCLFKRGLFVYTVVTSYCSY